MIRAIMQSTPCKPMTLEGLWPGNVSSTIGDSSETGEEELSWSSYRRIAQEPKTRRVAFVIRCKCLTLHFHFPYPRSSSPHVVESLPVVLDRADEIDSPFQNNSMRLDVENILARKFGATLPIWTKAFLRASEMLDALAEEQGEQSTSDEEDYSPKARCHEDKPFALIESNLQAVSVRLSPECQC
jgi:hypothetical protein